jgi:putative ATP-dependent endonuclease of OLD family
MFAKAARDIGAPMIFTKLREGYKALQAADEADKKGILGPLRDAVLNTARRFGKARFAQLAAVHAEHATTLPKYLADAVEWLRAE